MALSYLLLIFWTSSAFLCAHLAKQRNRNIFLWFALGLLFNVLAFLVIFFLPVKAKKPEAEVATNTLSMTQESNAKDSFYPSEDKITPREPLRKRIPTNQTVPWYFINKNLEKIGPLNLSELRKAFIENTLDDTTYIWCEEFDNWTQVKEFQNKTTLTDPDYA
jgi:hypothetical protein